MYKIRTLEEYAKESLVDTYNISNKDALIAYFNKIKVPCEFCRKIEWKFVVTFKYITEYVNRDHEEFFCSEDCINLWILKQI